MFPPVALALVAIELELHWYIIYTIIDRNINRLLDARSDCALGALRDNTHESVIRCPILSAPTR